MPVTVFLMIGHQFAYTLFYETPEHMFIPNSKGEVIINTYKYDNLIQSFEGHICSCIMFSTYNSKKQKFNLHTHTLIPPSDQARVLTTSQITIFENADSRRKDTNDFCLKYTNFGSPSHRGAFVLSLHCVPAASSGRSYGDPTAFLGCLQRPYCDHCVCTATILRPYHWNKSIFKKQPQWQRSKDAIDVVGSQ